LIDEKQRSGSIRFRAFYVRRLRRLSPALIAMVVIVSAIYARFGEWSGGEVLAGLLYAMNYYEIFGGETPIPIGPLWSLAIEEHFYLLFPLVIALAWRFREKLFYVLAAVCFALLLWRGSLVLSGANEARIYFATDTRIDSILFGCLLTIAIRLNFDLDFLARKTALLACAVMLVTTLVVRNPLFRETLRYSLQGLAFAPLFYFILTKRSLLLALLETAPMVWIGKLSYSLYLWHFPILDLCRHLPVPHAAQLAIAVAATFAAAVVSYYWIETPFRLRSRPIALVTHWRRCATTSPSS